MIIDLFPTKCLSGDFIGKGGTHVLVDVPVGI